MTLPEQPNRYPACPHRTGDHFCGYLSERLGRLYPISALFCNFTCRGRGPYCGEAAVDEKSFLLHAWERLSPVGGRKLAERVLRHYATPVEIEVPPEHPMIVSALADLNACPGFRGIMYTGSIIVANLPKPPKDYDLVLWFDTAEHAVAVAQKPMPHKINGVGVDYFFYIGDAPDIYFTTLDPAGRKIYTSRWFRPTIKSIPAGYEVVQRDPDRFGEPLTQMFTADELTVIKARGGWGGVRDLWRQAADFVTASKSRGILATAAHVTGLASAAGERVDDALLAVRRQSCAACPVLVAVNGIHYCGACGCGESELARLNDPDPNAYTKLHYPVLHCPLGRKGFTNSASEDPEQQPPNG